MKTIYIHKNMFENIKTPLDLIKYIKRQYKFENDLKYSINIILDINYVILQVGISYLSNIFNRDDRYTILLYNDKIYYPIGVDPDIYESMLSHIFEKIPNSENVKKCFITYNNYVNIINGE